MPRKALTDDQRIDAVLDLIELLRVDTSGVNASLRAIGRKYGVSMTTIRRAADALDLDWDRYTVQRARLRTRHATEVARTRSVQEKAMLANRIVVHLERELDYLDERLIEKGELTPTESARVSRALLSLQRILALDEELADRGISIPGYTPAAAPGGAEGETETAANVTEQQVLEAARERARKLREAGERGNA